ncbi:MAG: MBOAT family protein [Lachnospiraceae bacterium]|nr:MBOAT family protein [Lachnospiraceae bacterium]
MVFSSLSFLCIFLPVTLIVHYLLPERFVRIRNAFLILMSLVFYSYGEPVYVLLLLLCTVWTYLLTRSIAALDTYKDGTYARYRKALLAAGVILDFAVLGVFKYAGFLAGSFVSLFPAAGAYIHIPDIALPIGISFYTFQSVSYLIDVYRKDLEASKRYSKVLLYVSFFPQLIAGPILRYRDMDRAMDERHIGIDSLSEGMQRFIRGLSKKVLIANACGAAVDRVFALNEAALSSPLVILTALAYTFQIYFDFSGYSDMAIGMGRMFGFRFPENFDLPYTASSMRDFWRRWHISLSGWFRDYLYIPLGGNRKGRLRTVINRMIVFFCTGLWHGANWTFVFWGLFHGFFVSVENLPSKKKDSMEKSAGGGSLFLRLAKHVYVMAVVCTGFMIFRADSLKQAFSMILTAFTGACSTIVQKQALLTLH